MLELHEQGLSLAEIARRVGRYDSFVGDALADLGVHRKRRGRRRTPEELERIREMYVEMGISTTDIAAELGRTTEFVWRHLKEMGVKLDGKSRPRPRLPYDVLERTAELYRSGMTMAEVGRETGVSTSTVWYRLRQFGQERRTSAETVSSRPRPRTRHDLHEMVVVVRLYRSGLSLAQVSAETGMPPSKVRRRLLWAGERRRTWRQARQIVLERRARDSNPDLGLMRPAA